MDENERKTSGNEGNTWKYLENERKETKIIAKVRTNQICISTYEEERQEMVKEARPIQIVSFLLFSILPGHS